MSNSTETRKLAAIMFTDMVGYSALSQGNDRLAQELLEEHRALLRPLFARFNGTEIKKIGDAFLVEFHSALEAAQCGIEIQRALAKRNHDVSADRRIEIKIGIHIGDVVHRGGDVYGDGVNIASRIEPLAGAGGICISMDVERQIRNALEARFEKLAPTELKNISVAMDLFRIILPWEKAGSGRHEDVQKPKPATGSLPLVSSERPTVDPKSVAVLAFANLSGDKENEYFSDGISEELLNVLAKVQGLKVTARTSAFHFKGKYTAIPEIARQLGVAHVVEGSVRKSGGRVRITAQLIKASDGFHIWSDTFTRDLQDIFAVQDEIAGLIAKNLQLKLGTIAPARVVDPEAYRLFLQGRAIFNREILEQYAKAIESYRASLAIDETSAEAWAGLSKTYTISASSGMLTMEAGCELAHEAARRAIALDPNQAKGYASLGLVQLNYDWDWKGAADSLEQAVALAPGDVDTVGLMAHHAAITGQRERSLQLGRQAMELDPLNLSSGYARLRSLTNAGHFAELEKEAEHIIALNPSGFRSRMFLCLSRLLQGRADEAAAAAEQVPADWGRLTTLACARFAQGRKSESEANLIELVEKFGEHAIYQVAQVHAFRGEADQAFAWLEKAYRQRDSGMTLMKDDPVLKNLHGDDRWWPLLRKMKLADDQLT